MSVVELLDEGLGVFKVMSWSIGVLVSSAFVAGPPDMEHERTTATTVDFTVEDFSQLVLVLTFDDNGFRRRN